MQIRLTKLYDNFISNVTHELKSPLSSIQLYLETINSREVPPIKQKEFIDLMTRDVNRLKKLINSILEIPALEQKKLAHSYQVHDTETTVKQILANSIEQFRIPPEAVAISGSATCEFVVDIDALKVIFDNLIDNALKYSSRPVEIMVSLSSSSTKAIIEFTDNGIGIAPKEVKKIFNKFYRIYHKDIPNVKGTGLGLYRVKEIVKNHGGRISVSSDGPGRGSTFKIELPIYQISKKRFLNNLLKRAGEKSSGNNQ
jgi:signal transduction histidine kinase